MKKLLLLCLLLCWVATSEAFILQLLAAITSYIHKVRKSRDLWAKIDECNDAQDGNWYDFFLNWCGVDTEGRNTIAYNTCRESLRLLVRDLEKDPVNCLQPLEPCGTSGMAQYNIFSYGILKRRTLPC